MDWLQRSEVQRFGLFVYEKEDKLCWPFIHVIKKKSHEELFIMHGKRTLGINWWQGSERHQKRDLKILGVVNFLSQLCKHGDKYWEDSQDKLRWLMSVWMNQWCLTSPKASIFILESTFPSLQYRLPLLTTSSTHSQVFDFFFFVTLVLHVFMMVCSLSFSSSSWKRWCFPCVKCSHLSSELNMKLSWLKSSAASRIDGMNKVPFAYALVGPALSLIIRHDRKLQWLPLHYLGN